MAGHRSAAERITRPRGRPLPCHDGGPKEGIPGIHLHPGAAPGEQLRRLAANRLAVGSPAQVVDALLAQHRAGVTHATMQVSWPGMPQDDILAGLELPGREVRPAGRRRMAAGGG